MSSHRVHTLKNLSLAAVLSLATVAAAMQPAHLTCEHRADPLGIDTSKPRLSWLLEGGRKARAERQTAYQVLVASSKDRLGNGAGDLWDSGRVDSSQTGLIEYAGKPLASGQQCFWKVRVWDQDGMAQWSADAAWSMGLLASEDWKGQWIGLDEPDRPARHFTNGFWIWFPESAPERAAAARPAWFRREFELPSGQVVTAAWLTMTADNGFEVFLNGKRVGSGGNFTAAEVFDVAGALSANRNVLAVSVSNAGAKPNPAGLAGMLRIEFQSGEPLVILTDEKWRTTIEKFDNWDQPGFDGTTWLSSRNLGPVGMAPWGNIAMPEERRLPARYLRREFDVEKPVRRAVAYYSGLGLSEMWLNGKKTDSDVLSPGLTEYDKRAFYVTRDVTGMIRKGPNAIGVILGNGRYYAPRSKVPVPTRSFGFPKLLFQVRIEYADGTSDVVASDASWDLSANGPIRANNEYDGEEYDARLEFPGWAMPGFAGTGWQRAQVVAAPGGVISAQMIEPIRVTGVLKPKSVKEVRPGVFIFDMGQNMVGWCRLKVRGPTGTSVKLRHAEVLTREGLLYMDNIRGARVTDVYTLNGKGQEVYEPRFTYHGFRYVEMTGFPGKPSLDSIQGLVVNDDLDETGSFACSNPVVNRIFTNIVWGVRGNYRSIPTDCPQRDERQGWLGDRSQECRGESYIFNISKLYHKWLTDIADAQKPSGSVSDVCPSYWPLYNDNVTWPSSIVIIPGTLHAQYGDLKPIQEIYPAAKLWMDYMSTFVTNGIISKDSYGDWCVPPEDPKLIHSADPARKTDPALLATGFFYHDALLMEKYATLLGRTADAEHFGKLASDLKAGLNKKLYDPEKGYYGNGSQTSCVLPLAFGLAPEEAQSGIFARLVEKIASESKNHVGTGLIGGQWLMRTLTRHGRADLAWTIASQETYPSWGYMVGKDATTIWELWNGDTADPAMNSGNHVMLVGDLLIWMFENLAGIRPAPETPGFARIVMRPETPPGLDWVKATHRSASGLIESEWRKEAGKFVWRMRIPPNTTARVEVPNPSGKGANESGKPASQAKGVRVLGSEGGRQLLEVQSGTYVFESN
jgi:alpha-L-rhamnosidase